MVVNTTKSPHFDFYKREVDRAIKDCKMWNERVRLIVYSTIITETCDGRPFGWLNYTNPREPQFANYTPNDGDPPNKSWSTQRSGGLFQQQPQFWGPDVMDPYKTTVSFLIGYRFADGRTAAGLVKYDWQNMPIEKACQAVQGSEFGDGSNYKRNIQYARMVLDSPVESEKGWFQRLMANYNDFDDALDNSLVTYGIDDDYGAGRKESIRHNLWATNRAAYQLFGLFDHVGNASNNVMSTIGGLIRNLRSEIADEILNNRRWPWWNQEGVAPENQGTNTLAECVFATNGRVYHPTVGNKAISDKLDLVARPLQEVKPELIPLVTQYNESHVGVVPVKEIKNAEDQG
jgi:hypothetical protein